LILKPLYKILCTAKDWSTFFTHANNLSKHEKGELFEKLTELVLRTKPIYKTRYKNVWLLRDGIDSKLRTKLNLPNVDEGIDLIAELFNGSYCSIQCKFKGANESPRREDIATFLDLSRNHCNNITEQILIHTGSSGIKKTTLLPDSFTQIGLDFWSQLTEEDWLAIQLLIKGKKEKSLKRDPKPHQREAIAASEQYFLNDKNMRGKLIMPCGTGKSLTAYWITKALASKATIIAVPSLALIKQSLEDWTKEMLLSKTDILPEWCCICSDESTGQFTDDFFTDTYSLGIPTTTDEDEISNFLKRKTPGGKIIFTTYQSADKLAQVSKKLKFKFDLAILDEAHKTVGAKNKAFSILLQEDKISISKRLFMTATERIVKGAQDEILSMDDDKVYGKIFYKLSFKKAIEDGIITDYKIVTVLVNDTEIQDLIKKNKYIADLSKKIDEAEAQILTTAITLRKAIKEFNIRHTVSFHKSINASKEFQSLYQKIDTTAERPTVFHISSKLNAAARAELLKDFRSTSKAIITNARCLTEGVDVPAIDCVLFADQKQSVVDIVQASGRALRQYIDKNTGVKKEVGYIVIPVVLKEGESLDDLTESSRFKTVIRIVTSLSTQDETIAEELKLIDSDKQKIGSGKIQVIGSVTKSIRLDLKSFTAKINTKIWERIAKANWLPYNECITLTNTLGLNNVKEWRNYCASGNKPFDIPSKPYNVYPSFWESNNGWNGWLGISNKNNWEIAKNRFSYTEAKHFLKINCNGLIKTISMFNKWKSGSLNLKGVPQFPIKMPRNPYNTYNKTGEWVSNFDFFGTTPVIVKNKAIRVDFNLTKIPYKELKSIVQKEGLNSREEYKIWLSKYKNNFTQKGYYAPVKVESYGAEFEGWPVFLNSKNSRSRARAKGYVKTNFSDAKIFVHKLKLKSKTEWYKYTNGEMKGKPILPFEIPRNPRTSYSKEGWVSWSDWLGNKM
jgi:predicted helicase